VCVREREIHDFCVCVCERERERDLLLFFDLNASLQCFVSVTLCFVVFFFLLLCKK
jgi:hypothetical protein